MRRFIGNQYSTKAILPPNDSRTLEGDDRQNENPSTTFVNKQFISMGTLSTWLSKAIDGDD